MSQIMTQTRSSILSTASGGVQGEGHEGDRHVGDGHEDAALALARPLAQRQHPHFAAPPLEDALPPGEPAARGAGTNCIKIGLPGKLILSKRKGLWEVLFSWK